MLVRDKMADTFLTLSSELSGWCISLLDLCRTSTGQEMLERINIPDRESCRSVTYSELGCGTAISQVSQVPVLVTQNAGNKYMYLYIYKQTSMQRSLSY